MAPDNLYTTVEGDIEEVGKSIRITEIRVRYHLKVPDDKREEAEKVLGFHASGCPAYNSVKESIRVLVDADFESA